MTVDPNSNRISPRFRKTPIFATLRDSSPKNQDQTKEKVLATYPEHHAVLESSRSLRSRLKSTDNCFRSAPNKIIARKIPEKVQFEQ